MYVQIWPAPCRNVTTFQMVEVRGFNRPTTAKHFTSCVFGIREEYAILDGHEVIRLPSMKPVVFQPPLSCAMSTPYFLIGLCGYTNIKTLVIFCPIDWCRITQFDVEASSIESSSSSGRYIILSKYTQSGSLVSKHQRLLDLYKVTKVKLWMLLSSLLAAKSPLLTKGCYHPKLFVTVSHFFTRFSSSL